MIKAIARAFRWRMLLETCLYGRVEEIAEAEKINDSYVSRVLRLTLLAPGIVEAILDGRQADGLRLALLMRDILVSWAQQGRVFGTGVASAGARRAVAGRATSDQSARPALHRWRRAPH